MIVVRVSGGLGNQMFQYAYARALQAKGHEVLLHWHSHHSKARHNGFELDQVFQTPPSGQVPLATQSMLGRWNAWRQRKTNRQREVRELHFQPHFLESTAGYLDGYWQTEQYFEAIAEQIRSDFQFKPLSGGANLEMLERLKAEDYCSVHIRRGDYVGHPELGDVCDGAYYQRALAELEKRHPGCPLLVFSDDIDSSKDLLQDRKSIHFCDWNRGDSSWMDMALMQACTHHIIANSSFSWWGAWLGDPNGSTLAPAQWSLKPGAGTDVIPAIWQKI